MSEREKKALEGRCVAVLATDGVEQVELTEPVEALRAAGATVLVVAPKAGSIQAFQHVDKGREIPVDRELANVSPLDFDALVLPGGVVNSDDKTVIGDPNPEFTGGFSNNFTFQNFDLNVFMQFSVGNDVFNANRIIFEGDGRANQNMFATYSNRWTPENPNNEYYRTNGSGPTDAGYSTRVVEDGSYLRLKTVSLGYNFTPKLLEKIKLKTFRIYVSAQNLMTFTGYQGYDPEVSRFGNSPLRPGFDYSIYPRSRTITFGANISL